MKRKLAALVAAMVAFTGTMWQPANATSVHDNSYTEVDSLLYGAANYYGINCSMQDVTSNFLAIFNNRNNWVYDSEFDTYWSDFLAAYQSGSWAVGVRQRRMSTGYDMTVELIWNSSGGEIEFLSPPTTVLPSVYVEYTGGVVLAQLYMKQVLLGTGGCVPAIRALTSGGTLSTSPGVDVNTTTNGSYWSNYAAIGWSYQYPSGYEGALIDDVRPTSPELYHGSVDCINEQPTFMNLTQDGNTYNIPLTQVSPYKAEWDYFLSDGSYVINVGCGDKLAASYNTVTPMPPTSNDWICNPIDAYNPHYCVLS